MGVDHLDNVWAWNAADGTISMSTVNADAEFGIAVLSASGDVVDIYSWKGVTDQSWPKAT